MGYVDRDGGQFTVARRGPGGDQVMGSLSLALSLMNCLEIQEEKKKVEISNKRTNLLEKKTKLLQQQIHNLQLQFNTDQKQRKLVYDSSHNSTNMALGSVRMEETEYTKTNNKNDASRHMNFNQPDWTCITVNNVPCVISRGVPYSSIYNLSDVAHFEKIKSHFRRKKQVHCIKNEHICAAHKEGIIQHLGITNEQRMFKLYNKSAVDNFCMEL
jgi:hypothetical protein